MVARQRVLLVEESGQNLRAMQELLGGLGADLVGTVGRDEAIAAARLLRFAAAVVDDRVLGTDGLELAETLLGDRARAPVPVILLTGSNPARGGPFGRRRRDAVDRIGRPFPPEVLVHKLADLLELDRHRESDARRGEERWRRALDEMLEGCQIIGFDWRYLYVNDALASQARLPKSELLGRRMTDVFPGIDRTEMFLRLRRCMMEREPHRMKNEFVHPDGSRGWFELSIRPVPEGISVLSIDITSSEAAQAALRTSERKYRALVSNIPGMVYREGPDGSMEILSGSLAVCGYAPAEFAAGDVDWRGLIRPEDRRRILEGRANLLRTPSAIVQEYRIAAKDGSVRWVTDYKTSFPGTDDSIAGIDGVAFDITNQRNMEAQLHQAQKLESIGTLAGGVAHEINNPIMGIMNYAELIRDESHSDSRPAEFAREIIRETQVVAGIVSGLLSFARPVNQADAPASLRDIVEATLSLVRTILRHDQIRIEVDIPPDLPPVRCRSQQIQQVLMNLITNARDSLNEKYPDFHDDKRIAVRAREIEGAEAERAARGVGRRRVRLTVEDRGTGIPEALLRRVFDPFFTTKPREKGTGLGLSISYGIVKDHGGRLSVESEVGAWTRFHVDLFADGGGGESGREP